MPADLDAHSRAVNICESEFRLRSGEGQDNQMTPRIDEIAEGIFRISVFVPEIAPPEGFGFNSFLILGDEPLLFHAGRRDMFPLFSEAVRSILPLERLRWISFGHVEADECGAMN